MEAQSEPTIFISVGSGDVRINGQEARLAPRERNLLVALAASGRLVPATSLVEMLYSDLPYDRGINALRVCIHRIRSRFGRSFIEMFNSGYRLPKSILVDLREGRGLLSAKLTPELRARALEIACALRGDVTGSLAYEDWYLPFGRAAKQLGNEIAMQVARAALRDGLYVDANEIAKQLTLEEPTNEDAWQLAVASQLMLGRRFEAVESFHTLRDHLNDELGIPPSESICELIAQTLAESESLRRFEMLR